MDRWSLYRECLKNTFVFLLNQVKFCYVYMDDGLFLVVGFCSNFGSVLELCLVVYVFWAIFGLWLFWCSAVVVASFVIIMASLCLSQISFRFVPFRLVWWCCFGSAHSQYARVSALASVSLNCVCICVFSTHIYFFPTLSTPFERCALIFRKNI